MEENLLIPDEERIPQEAPSSVPQPESAKEAIQPEQEPLSEISEIDEPIISSAEINNDLLVPDENTFLEGQFEEIPVEERTAEENKPRIKPALLAVIAILALTVLCLIMGLIIFFMVLPDIRADRELGALVYSFYSSLVAI